MKRPTLKDQGWNLAAILAAGAGLALTVHTLRVTPPRLHQLERRADTFRQLQELEATHSARRSALDSYRDQAGGERPVPLEELAAAAFPGRPVQSRERPVQPAAGGWMLRRVDLVLDGETTFEQVAGLIRRAEASRPPWRLTECRLAASEREGMASHVALQFETLWPETGR